MILPGGRALHLEPHLSVRPRRIVVDGSDFDDVLTGLVTDVVESSVETEDLLTAHLLLRHCRP